MEGDTNTMRMTFDDGSFGHQNCLHCLEDFDGAVEKMRSMDDGDVQSFLDSMTEQIKVAFNDLDESGEDANFVAERATDRLYRIVSRLKLSDVYTYGYVSIVVRELFIQLAKRNLIIYYVLDNALRDDRFEAISKVFDRVEIKVITPRHDGTDWSTLSNLIEAHNRYRGHVAYIEPDALVNYVEPAVSLAKELECIATFRNDAPEDPFFQVVTMPRTGQ